MTFCLLFSASSFLSIYFSYMVMHLALGKGRLLIRILLNQAAWSLISCGKPYSTLLGILSFLLGLLPGPSSSSAFSRTTDDNLGTT